MTIENCTNEFLGIHQFPNCSKQFNNLVWNPIEKLFRTCLTEPSVIVYMKDDKVFDVFAAPNPKQKIEEDKEILKDKDIDYVYIAPVRSDFEQEAGRIVNTIKQG